MATLDLAKDYNCGSDLLSIGLHEPRVQLRTDLSGGCVLTTLHVYS